MFLYSKKEKKNILFIKISDLRDFETIFNKMKIVYDKLPKVVPKPIIFFRLGKHQVLVTKTYDIELLTNKYNFNLRKRIMLLHSVIDNIKDLHLKTRDGHLVFDKGFCLKNILPKVDGFFKRWKEKRLCEQFKLHMNKLSDYYGLVIPSIPQHGDLVMSNTGMIDNKLDKIIFVDWDSYSEIKLPMYDILIFLKSFAECYYSSMYVDNKYISFIINGVLTNYCDSFELDRNFVIELYPICLLLYALLRSKVDIGVVMGQENAVIEMKRFFGNREKFILTNKNMGLYGYK